MYVTCNCCGKSVDIQKNLSSLAKESHSKIFVPESNKVLFIKRCHNCNYRNNVVFEEGCQYYAKEWGMMKLEIGQTVYRFDLNHRVYEKGNSAPIFEKHFIPYQVIAEDEKTYKLDRFDLTINKKTGNLVMGKERLKYYTETEKIEYIWEHNNRYGIIRLVEITSIENLKKIAEIIGYKEK